ncbi:MAG: anti-sigma factor family protein [Streptosporangiaceae bacterium]
MTRHVSTEASARFREGDLSPRRAARIRAHLAACTRCAAASESLGSVTDLLAAATMPPIPEHLSARIQQALATEASARAAGEVQTTPAAGRPRAAPAHSRRGTSTPVPRLDDSPGRNGPAARSGLGRRGWPSRRTALGTLAAAGAVVILAAGGYGISKIGVSSSLSASSSGAASAGSKRAAANAAAGAASAPRVREEFGPELPYRAGRTFTPVASGTNYLPASLAMQVKSQMAQSRIVSPVPSAGPRKSAAGAESVRGGGQFGGGLAGCVARVSAGRSVTFVDVARYEGRKATVMVVSPGGQRPGQILVTGPACSSSQSDVIARQALPPG